MDKDDAAIGDTPARLAREISRLGKSELELRARCAEAGVDPKAEEAAVLTYRSLVLAKGEIGSGLTSEDGFLESRYDLVRGEVRSGGQGGVTFGRERGGERRRVAIKYFSRPASAQQGMDRKPAEVEAVTKNGRSTKHLRRNLVEFLEVGYWSADHLHKGKMAAVMLRADLTLADLITSERPLAPIEACRLILILARVIADLDAVHRDLKPENVLLFTEAADAGAGEDAGTVWEYGGSVYRPVVSDLGLAKPIDSEGNADATVQEQGTLAYMSPEQLVGGHIGKSADIYCCGMILVKCLTGKLPFDGGAGVPQKKNVEAYFRTRILREAAPRLCTLGGREFDPRLDRIVRKCLRKGSHRRYDADELCADLERFLDGGEVEAEALSVRLDEEDLLDGDPAFAARVESERRWRRRIISASLFVTLGVSVVGLAVANNALRGRVAALTQRDRANAEKLLTMPADAFLHQVDQLAPSRAEILPHIRDLAHAEIVGPGPNVRASEGRNRARAELALVRLVPAEWPNCQEDLLRWLDEADSPREAILVRDVLRGARVEVAHELWDRTSSAVASGDNLIRFRSLLALAVLDPRDRRWTEHAEFVAQQVLTADPLHYADLYGAFDEVRHQLRRPLISAYRTPPTQEQGVRAAGMLARHHGDDPGTLLELLDTADGPQFRAIRAALIANEAVLVPELRRIVAQAEPGGPPPPPDKDREAHRNAIQAYHDRHAYKRANAAVALLAIGKQVEHERVWTLLRHSPDPSTRSYLLHAFSTHGLALDTVLGRYRAARVKKEPPDLRQALLLALGV